MNISQEKLDVKNKTRANLFNWRGQFTPEFVEYILENFSCKGNLILDPFSGSGTVLSESASKGLECYGYEINPAAYLMSKFFSFSNLKPERRIKFLQRVELALSTELKILNGQPVYQENSDYRSAYKNLLNFGKKLIKYTDNEDEKIFLLNLLFLSERDKELKLKDSVLKSFSYLKKSLLGLPCAEKIIDAKLQDARTVSKNFVRAIDLIITSPPYINVFNYHQNYRGIIEIFGYDSLKVAESEFGSNRKNRGNRFRTVIQYCLDMEQSLNSFWHALKVGGKMVIVVGRKSNVRKTPFYNGSIVQEILSKMQGFKPIENLERSFTNKFGEVIKEDILVVSKADYKVDFEIGKSVAEKHLEQALVTSNDDSIILDLRDAIENINAIEPSPLFSPKSIFNGK